MSSKAGLGGLSQCTPSWRRHRWEEVRRNKHGEIIRVRCPHCGQEADVRRRDGRDYSGGPDGEEWVDCPKCGNRAVIRSW